MTICFCPNCSLIIRFCLDVILSHLDQCITSFYGSLVTIFLQGLISINAFFKASLLPSMSAFAMWLYLVCSEGSTVSSNNLGDIFIGEEMC